MIGLFDKGDSPWRKIIYVQAVSENKHILKCLLSWIAFLEELVSGLIGKIKSWGLREQGMEMEYQHDGV